MTTQPIPFLAALRGDVAIRDFAAALPAQKRDGAIVSLWDAKPTKQAAPVDLEAQKAELAAARAAAVEAGRAEGLKETEALRAKLAALIAAAQQPREAKLDEFAATIAGIAGEVIGAWTGAEDRATLFAPIVKAWGAHEATARVNPADVAAMTAAVRNPAASPGRAASAISSSASSGAGTSADGSSGDLSGVGTSGGESVGASSAVGSSGDGTSGVSGAEAGAGAKISVVADATVNPGDVIVASPERELVLAWKARIAELREAVAAAIVAAR